MARRIPIAVLAVCWSLLAFPGFSFAQQDQGDSTRKVVNRVYPEYPDMARPLKLSGSVRVEALVGANGSVKSVQVKGGHPVLAQAAAEAVRKWKWVPAKTDTKEPVIVKFEPPN